MRYTTASASVGVSSSGSRNATVRRETSFDVEAIPGVSIKVVARRLCAGQSTTSRSHSSADVAPRLISSAPSCRRTGSGRGVPMCGCSTIRGVVPSRYQVTTRVHSPASVGATCSPTSALSSVDLPAFTLPAIATRSGSSSRRSWSCSHRAVSGWWRYASIASSSTRRAESASAVIAPLASLGR